MPLPLPNLDTRTFDDLVAEMRTLIPQYTQDWTNHNPSDPGMTLVEVMAWITESTVYRLNRIPETTHRKFIALLSGEAPQPDESLESAKRRALEFFNEPYRAITAADFERQAKAANDEIARVRIMADAEEGRITTVLVPKSATLTYKAEGAPAVADDNVTAVFVPQSTADIQPAGAVLESVKKRLDERKLVGTKVLVTGPTYTVIQLEITVRQRPNTLSNEVIGAVANSVQTFLDPILGGSDGNGWRFDRPLSEFELDYIIEPIPGVDHVEQIVMKKGGTVTQGEIAIQNLDLPLLQSLTVVALKPQDTSDEL